MKSHLHLSIDLAMKHIPEPPALLYEVVEDMNKVFARHFPVTDPGRKFGIFAALMLRLKQNLVEIEGDDD
jgi:hypothetical protein